MDEEKKLLIKRTDSSVEITVGERDSPIKDKEPESPHDPESDNAHCLECCPALDRTCCFKPLTKLQLCILAIIAIVTLILALFVIIVLVGVIASHAHRLRDLEIKMEMLEASNSHLKTLAKNLNKNETEFEREMRTTIEGAMNQFNIIYIQTLSLFSMKDQLESKVDQLINMTDNFDIQLELLAAQVRDLQPNRTVEIPFNLTQLAIEEDDGFEDDDNFEDVPEDECNMSCENVVVCIRFAERSKFLCAQPIKAEDFQDMKNKYLDKLNLEYHCHCVSG